MFFWKTNSLNEQTCTSLDNYRNAFNLMLQAQFKKKNAGKSAEASIMAAAVLWLGASQAVQVR